MKVAKCVRLLSKDNKGLYKKDGASEVKRERAVIEESVVKQSEATYKDTGILWIVDQEATKERNSSKGKPAKKATKETK